MIIKYKLIYLIALLTVFSCGKEDVNISDNKTEYKQKMREFVIGISQYAKTQYPNFFIIPQNGIELVSSNGYAYGQPHAEYLNAIDTNGQEDL